MSDYNHRKIEKKWQKFWDKQGANQASRLPKKKKFYGLIEFPYPSGDGLHVGHVRSYTAMDVLARKRRAEGYEVLYPIGWDAFGLPTENYAIKTGLAPQVVTKKNTDTFRRQLKSLGFSFDWNREVNTTDPAYYRWTQWIFLEMFKKGLAYKKKMAINWCPNCKIGLANEEVIDGKCERCDAEVVEREKEQWMLAITQYADRLDKDLAEVDFWEKIKAQQHHWIGKSEGAQIRFKIFETLNKKEIEEVEIFTTRADTLFGVTYLVLSPSYGQMAKIIPFVSNRGEVEKYIAEAKKKKNKTLVNKEKTGIKLAGLWAKNPANGEEIPVFVADYVVADYGTGAVMAVPAHDERDFEFAKKHNLPMREVVEKLKENYPQKSFLDNGDDLPYVGGGVLINSQEFNGLSSLVAAKKIIEKVSGRNVFTYKLRDWIFSRQRYWGEPIPLIYCGHCAEKIKNQEIKPASLGEEKNPGWFPVSAKDLPVVLPKIKNYKPTDSGESPLALVSSFVKTKCPKCGGVGRRETDVMPNWAGSSWYFLRYIDPKNKKVLADKKLLKKWSPIDWYNGGMEHTTLHLLYSRFWHKFLFDLKVVPTKEPYKKRTSHGLILGEGGIKMSKSKGNVVNPDKIVETYGADTLRLYELFLGPFAEPVAWQEEALIGPRRFLERVWRLGGVVLADQKSFLKAKSSAEVGESLAGTIKKISEDIETMSFNTAVSQLMICLNVLEKNRFNLSDFKVFLRLLAIFAPHLTEELWQKMGEKKSIHLASWPALRKIKTSNLIKMAVQINGKVRGAIMIERDAPEARALTLIKEMTELNKWFLGKNLQKVVYIPGRILSLVLVEK